MPKTADKPIKVTINIQPGPTSPAQKQAWKCLWQKLISQVVDEVKYEPK